MRSAPTATARTPWRRWKSPKRLTGIVPAGRRGRLEDLLFHEILLRSKQGPLVEEKEFDMSLFRKTQELQKKYDLHYDPEKPLDLDGTMADRLFQAGVRAVPRPGDLLQHHPSGHQGQRSRSSSTAIEACPEAMELGEGADRVRMVHREVEGDQEPVVVAGIQTAPFSDEEMMFTIYRGLRPGCLRRRDLGRHPAQD